MGHAYMNEPERGYVETHMNPGQAIAGSAIGIVVLDLWYPYMPGNVANASTFRFPVTYKILKGTSGPQIARADPAILDIIIEAGREFQVQGIRALIGACGYFGSYQKDVSAALDIPVFMSSLLQTPMIRRSLKPSQKVGVLCAMSYAFTPELLGQCGVDGADLVFTGAENLPQFRNLIEGTGHFDSCRLEQELVGLAEQLVEEHPEIGAILLECSDMPPYAWAIQNAIKLPVFDFITLIDWVQRAVVRRPFAGFI